MANNDADAQEIPSTSSAILEARKKVRFSDIDMLATYHDETSSNTSHGDIPAYAPKNFRIRERRSQASIASDARGKYLSIRPGDELVFEKHADPEKESADVIRLTNIFSKYVAFKVKTTAPEKFRVKPSFGCIECGGSKTVEVTVQPGLVAGAQKDRFLIMSVPLDNEPASHEELVDYWRELLKEGTASGDTSPEIDEHKLRCAVVTQPIEVLLDEKTKIDRSEPSLEVLEERLTSIESKLDELISSQRTSVSAQRRTMWNSLTAGLALMLLFLFTKVLTVAFSSPSGATVATNSKS